MSKKKKLSDYDFTRMNCYEAAQIGPFGRGDGPVDVTCYGQTHHFKSRKAAMAFFKACILATEGCEMERYVKIYFDLDAGLVNVTDRKSCWA